MQLLKNFTTLDGTRRFFTVSTSPCPEPDQYSPSYILCLPSDLFTSAFPLKSYKHSSSRDACYMSCLPSDLFTSAFPLKSYKHSSSRDACYMSCPSHPPRPNHSTYIWRRLQDAKLLITHSELLRFWTSSIVRNSTYSKIQRFGNWICLRHQVRRGRHSVGSLRKC
jgi:hypothetical protein